VQDRQPPVEPEPNVPAAWSVSQGPVPWILVDAGGGQASSGKAEEEAAIGGHTGDDKAASRPRRLGKPGRRLGVARAAEDLQALAAH